MNTKGYDCVMIPGASNGLTPIVMRPNTYCGRSKGLVKSAAGAISTTVCSKFSTFLLFIVYTSILFIVASQMFYFLNY